MFDDEDDPFEDDAALAAYEERLAVQRASAISAGRRKAGLAGAAMAGAMFAIAEIIEGPPKEDVVGDGRVVERSPRSREGRLRRDRRRRRRRSAAAGTARPCHEPQVTPLSRRLQGRFGQRRFRQVGAGPLQEAAVPSARRGDDRPRLVLEHPARRSCAGPTSPLPATTRDRPVARRGVARAPGRGAPTCGGRRRGGARTVALVAVPAAASGVTRPATIASAASRR